MNHDVAVGAGAVLEHAGLLINSGPAPRRYREQLSGVKHVGVTPLAEHGFFHDQQGLVRRAMRIVAVEAAFTNRRMLIEERPTLFGVALIALVIDGVRGNQALGLGAVRVVAVGAKHSFLA